MSLARSLPLTYEPAPVAQPFRLPSMSDPGRRRLGNARDEGRPHVSGQVREIGTTRKTVDDVGVWLEKVYDLCQKNKIDPAIDLILDTIDDMLFTRDVALCDQILYLADVERMSLEAMIALLSETARASAALPSRKVFYDRVEAKLRRDRERDIEGLLAGLG